MRLNDEPLIAYQKSNLEFSEKPWGPERRKSPDVRAFLSPSQKTCRSTLDAFGLGDELQSIVGPDVTGNTPLLIALVHRLVRAFPWAGSILKIRIVTWFLRRRSAQKAANRADLVSSPGIQSFPGVCKRTGQQQFYSINLRARRTR